MVLNKLINLNCKRLNLKLENRHQGWFLAYKILNHCRKGKSMHYLLLFVMKWEFHLWNTTVYFKIKLKIKNLNIAIELYVYINKKFLYKPYLHFTKTIKKIIFECCEL